MRFQLVIIFRFMTHPLFLLFMVIGNLLMGNIENVFLSILGWLFINLILGKSSYLYGLYNSWKEKRESEELSRKKVLEEKLPISRVIEGVFKGVNDFIKNDKKFQEFLRSERLNK